MTRALLVDDSEAVLTQLQAILATRPEGIETRIARDLGSARRVLAEWRPDIIFLDVMLAHEHGLDLLWDVGRALGDVTIVTMSGHPSDHPDVLAARRLGRHHIVKPLRAAAVDEAFARQSA